MKNLISILFVIHLLMFNAVAQQLIDVNKKWINCEGTYGTANPDPLFMHSNICRFDTNGPVIGNDKYAKLMYSTDSTEMIWTEHGFMRETEDGKVYYRTSLADTVDKLVYDFGADLGDTVTVYYILYGIYHTQAVFAVDSVFFAGQMRKRIYGPGIWIEGIGCRNGLLCNLSWMVGYAWLLNCYFENDVLLYHDTIYQTPACFFEYTSIADPQGDAGHSCKIVPNPVSGRSSIILSEALLTDASCIFELYSTLGECVSVFPVQSRNSLSKDDFRGGLYFYRIRNKEGIKASGKVIIE